MPIHSAEGPALPARRRLLDAAEHLLRTVGPAGTTTKAMAARARCSEGVLYKHFAGKEDLLVCLLRERLPALVAVSRLGATCDTGIGTPGTEQWCSLLVRRITRFYDAALPLLAPLLADPDLLAAYRADLQAAPGAPAVLLEAVTDALRHRRATGHIRPEADLEAAAAMLGGAGFQRCFLRHCRFFEDTGDREFTAGLARALARVLAPDAHGARTG
nr:TetR/AcrR family transcriptional regulator [Streptomyces sp. NBC_00886]